MVLFLFIPLLLIGCTEEFALDSGNATSAETPSYLKSAEERLYELYPENVKNGIVSEDVYLETNRFITSFAKYVDKIKNLQLQANENYRLYSDPTFKKDYLDALDDFDVFLKGFHIAPSTDADFEITSNFDDALYYYSLFTASYRDFVNSNGTIDTNYIQSYNNSFKTSYLAMADSLEKYELYKDK